MKPGDLVEVEWVDPNLFNSNIGVVVDTRHAAGGIEVKVFVDGCEPWLGTYYVTVISQAS